MGLHTDALTSNLLSIMQPEKHGPIKYALKWSGPTDIKLETRPNALLHRQNEQIQNHIISSVCTKTLADSIDSYYKQYQPLSHRTVWKFHFDLRTEKPNQTVTNRKHSFYLACLDIVGIVLVWYKHIFSLLFSPQQTIRSESSRWHDKSFKNWCIFNRNQLLMKLMCTHLTEFLFFFSLLLLLLFFGGWEGEMKFNVYYLVALDAWTHFSSNQIVNEANRWCKINPNTCVQYSTDMRSAKLSLCFLQHTYGCFVWIEIETKV